MSGNSAFNGGGIYASGPVTLKRKSIVSNNSATFGGGIDGPYCRSPLTLADSIVSGNTVTVSGGGILACKATLSFSTVSGNTASSFGGGITSSHLTMTNSIVSNNTAQRGGGIDTPITGNTLTLTNSTVSGNSAGTTGGGVGNDDLLTVTNSTVSGNTAADRGGGVDSTGTVTFTNSTVTGNASGRVAGGLFNTGTVTLVQSLLSGNTAVNGPEAYSVANQSGGGTVSANGFNVFGHDGSPGIAGFTLGASDVVPADPLAAILDPTLGYNGGATRTHALVFGSPAVNVVFGAPCATTTDQRGAPRAQDGDGESFNDCDSGAVERGQVPVQASLNSTRLDCRTAECRVPVTCNLTEAGCTNEVEVTVRTRPRRNSEGTVTKAARLIRFAAGFANIPPGGTGTVSLTLTKQGKRLVRATTKRRLKGVLGIREIATTVSNTPLTISRTDVTIKLKRRK